MKKTYNHKFFLWHPLNLFLWHPQLERPQFWRLECWSHRRHIWAAFGTRFYFFKWKTDILSLFQSCKSWPQLPILLHEWRAVRIFLKVFELFNISCLNFVYKASFSRLSGRQSSTLLLKWRQALRKSIDQNYIAFLGRILCYCISHLLIVMWKSSSSYTPSHNHSHKTPFLQTYRKGYPSNKATTPPPPALQINMLLSVGCTI